MSVVLAVRNRDGSLGRCDAKCYDATIPRCRCVCGGKNHGKGLVRALAQIDDVAAQYEGGTVEVQTDPRRHQGAFDFVTDDD